MEKKQVTIYDVAHLSGVSLATVSRVINKTVRVKPETEKKVLDAIEKLGYVPSAVAQSLASSKTTTVGVYCPEITRLSISQKIQGIIDMAHYYDYSIMISTDTPTENEEKFLDSFIKKRVDGILIISDELTDKMIEEMKKTTDIPIILVATEVADEMPSVSIDFEGVSYEVVKKLIDKGAKNIAFVGGAINNSINKLKAQGYKRAVVESGLDINILNAPRHYNDIDEVLGDEIPKYDAVLATRDSLAVGIMNAARKRELVIPDDIQVAAFDNTKYARMARPTLTSVSYSIYDLGAVAMQMLTKLMKGEEVDKLNVELPYEVIYRETTK